jgi:hypothetical protein
MGGFCPGNPAMPPGPGRPGAISADLGGEAGAYPRIDRGRPADNAPATRKKMLNALLPRWTRPRCTSTLTTLQQDGTRQPRAARASGDSLWQSLLRLLPGESDSWSGVPANALPAARADFEACLAGLRADSRERLLHGIHGSRSLRELWHLRTWLYTEIARAHSQHEAERRLAPLNRYFGAFAPAAARKH